MIMQITQFQVKTNNFSCLRVKLLRGTHILRLTPVLQQRKQTCRIWRQYQRVFWSTSPTSMKTSMFEERNDLPQTAGHCQSLVAGASMRQENSPRQSVCLCHPGLDVDYAMMQTRAHLRVQPKTSQQQQQPTISVL